MGGRLDIPHADNQEEKILIHNTRGIAAQPAGSC